MSRKKNVLLTDLDALLDESEPAVLGLQDPCATAALLIYLEFKIKIFTNDVFAFKVNLELYQVHLLC